MPAVDVVHAATQLDFGFKLEVKGITLVEAIR